MNEVLKTIVSLTVSAAVITALLFACKPLYRNRLSKSWQYYIWMIVVIRMLVPFSPERNLTDFLVSRQTIRQEQKAAKARNYQYQEYLNQEFIPEEEKVMGETVLQAADQPSAWADLRGNIWLLWFVPALVLLVKKITSYHSFLRFIRAGRQPVRDSHTAAAYEAACEDTGIRRPIPIYKNALAVSPMLVGIIRPYIIIPVTNYDFQELKLILCHELVHYKRCDILYKWLVQIAVCVHWFNPLAFLMASEVGKNCELSCDEVILKQLDTANKRKYGDTLLAALKTGGSYRDTVASVTLNEDGKMLKERLEAIMKFTKKSKAVTIIAAFSAFVIFCSAAYAGAYTGAKHLVGYDQSRSEVVSGSVSSYSNIVSAASDLPEEDKVNNSVYYQNYFYREGYVYGVVWKEDDALAQYPVKMKMAMEGTSYVVVFDDDAQAYAKDETFQKVLKEELTDMLRHNSYMKNHDGFFIISEVEGSYHLPPDQMAVKFYEEDKLSLFISLIPYTNSDVVIELLHRIYEEDNEDYLIFVLEALPSDYRADELAARAVADEKGDMLFWLLGFVDENVKQKLLEEAIKTDNMEIIENVYYSLDDIEGQKYAETAYQSNDVDIFELFLYDLEDNELMDYLERSYMEDNIRMFEEVMDIMPDEVLEVYLRRAEVDQKMGVQKLLEEYLTD